MAGKENLRPVSSKDEARERGRKGGLASGEARRKRKTLKEELLLMLEDETVQQSIAAALIREATEGNSSKSVRAAFETIRDTIGEKPIDKVQMESKVDVAASTDRLRALFGELKNNG